MTNLTKVKIFSQRCKLKYGENFQKTGFGRLTGKEVRVCYEDFRPVGLLLDFELASLVVLFGQRCEGKQHTSG